MAKFRKKPVIIEAVQWNGKNFDEVMNFMQEFHGSKLNYENAEELAYKTGELYIQTLEGLMTASKEDWIIKGVSGEFTHASRTSSKRRMNQRSNNLKQNNMN